ncbi:MAG: ArnT family glycosyltransferase [bacterium]
MNPLKAMTRPERAALIAILLAAAIFRFGRIDAGLPAVFLSDEELVTKNALSLAARRTLEPLYFDYPTLQIYLLGGLYAALFVVGRVTGLYASPLDFGVKFFIDPTAVYLVGRAASAAMGVGAVFAAFLVGRRFYGTRAGLFGALLLAIGIESAREAGLATPNAPLALLAILAFLPIHSVLTRGRMRDSVAAGLAIGLAVSAKYNSALLVLPLAIAHVSSWRSARAARDACGAVEAAHATHATRATARDAATRFAAALLVAAATFVAINPYWILEFGKYWDGYLYQALHMRTGHIGFMGKPPIVWAIVDLVRQERTAGILALVGGGLALAIRRPGDWLLLAFIVPSFLVIASLKNQQLDYLASLWPPAAVLGGRALAAIAGAVRGASTRRGDGDGARPIASAGARDPSASRARALAAATIVVCAVTPSLAGALAELRGARTTDTRDAARTWIESNIPAGAGVAFDHFQYDARLLDAGRARRSKLGREHVGSAYAEALETALAGRATYRLVPIIVPSDTLVLPVDEIAAEQLADLRASVMANHFLRTDFSTRSRTLDELIAEGAEYVMLSSKWIDRYVAAPPPPRESLLYWYWLRERNAFNAILSDPRLVVVRRWESGGTTGLVGPRVALYRIDAPLPRSDARVEGDSVSEVVSDAE